MEIKFRFFSAGRGKEGKRVLFTGFQVQGVDLYDGDLLEHDMYKKCEVFWCQKTGMWRLRQSYGQAKPTSSPLYRELELFNYKINGNIHER